MSRVKWPVVATVAVVVAVAVSHVLMGCNDNAPGKMEGDLSSSAKDIAAYLAENLLSPGFGGDVFASYEILGTNAEEVYIWAYAQEFYRRNGILEEGTGISCPVVLTLQGGIVVGHRLPRDGNLYAQDVRTMFPRRVRDAVTTIHQGQTISKLRSDVERQAREALDQ